ncbi:MAG TPA: flagellar hook-basal body complex protein FliE [Ramlibacter sp.]|uniref:flagellar hook-basal body complex protein FliE n=1 Tax=Ramlibacter sp. TaxID=1917967 RepID=UPI002D7E6AD5|nr:flagellar hook-basal body complex protein FliE [Ramlibacter sp.]HET8748743.1 flagellar hook-basal body complex protein FliE [Ramlibacter sp.]
MNLEAIQAMGLHDEVPGTAPVAAPVAEGPGFGAQVAQGLQALNQQLLASQVDLQRLAAGETANLHEVMVRLEESRIALQFALQVRNRALEAYQDVMRMQV